LAAGLRPNPLGSLIAPPDYISAIEGVLLLSGGKGRRQGGERKERGGAMKGERRGERKGRDMLPSPSVLDPPVVKHNVRSLV